MTEKADPPAKSWFAIVQRVDRFVSRLILIAAAVGLLVLFLYIVIDHRWMHQKLVFSDGTFVVLEHRAHGTFRTTIWNKVGEIVDDVDGAADSRHVNLYRSPSGRIIMADYGREPAIIQPSTTTKPFPVGKSIRHDEYRLSSQWQYLGAVRRTKHSELGFFRNDPECQDFGEVYSPPIQRKVQPCRDANYVGLAGGYPTFGAD